MSAILRKSQIQNGFLVDHASILKRQDSSQQQGCCHPIFFLWLCDAAKAKCAGCSPQRPPSGRSDRLAVQKLDQSA